MLPITLTGIAALVAASVLLMTVGLRRSILNPYLSVCFSYFRFFAFPINQLQYAVAVDLANLLAFTCFSVAFLHGTRGSGRRMRHLLAGMWPVDHCRRVPDPVSQRGVALLACVAISYLIVNLLSVSVAYDGLERALVRFYVGAPERDVSPWLMRTVNLLRQTSAIVVFVLRLNYVLYGRGRMAMWIALAAYLIAAFPAGSAGGVITPVFLWVVADVLAGLYRNESLRPRLDIVVLMTAGICGAMLLLAIRGVPFDNMGQVVALVRERTRPVAEKAISTTMRSHSMISDEIAFCMETFGRSQDFMPGHTLYTIVVNPIPREIWPGKPLAFGRVLGQIRQGVYKRPNAAPQGWSVAAGLAGEGYANAGYAGIVVLSLLIGYVCGKAAKCAMIGYQIPSYPILVVSLQLYVFSTLFVRGDIHSAWTSTVYPLLILTAVFAMWTRVSSALRVACTRE